MTRTHRLILLPKAAVTSEELRTNLNTVQLAVDYYRVRYYSCMNTE